MGHSKDLGFNVKDLTSGEFQLGKRHQLFRGNIDQIGFSHNVNICKLFKEKYLLWVPSNFLAIKL